MTNPNSQPVVQVLNRNLKSDRIGHSNEHEAKRLNEVSKIHDLTLDLKNQALSPSDGRIYLKDWATKATALSMTQ